jgi:hypothetical protein
LKLLKELKKERKERKKVFKDKFEGAKKRVMKRIESEAPTGLQGVSMMRLGKNKGVDLLN